MIQQAQIVFASRTEDENQFLRERLTSIQIDHRDAVFVSLHHHSLLALMDPASALVILNYVDFGDRQKVEVENLRASGYAGSILIIARNFAPGMASFLRSQKSLISVDKTFVERDLEGLVRKVLTDREIAQRLHRRFHVSQDVEISSFGSQTAYTSRVCNLSVGGAYLEFMSPPALIAGELVRVRFELSEMNRVYVMPARVVWSRRGNGQADYGVGVEFIGPGDVKTRSMHT